MAEIIKAWQCIGCGRLEGPAQCIGVCQDRAVDLVDAVDFRAALARAGALEEVVRRIATTFPKKGQSEETWRALQAEARRALALAPPEEPLATSTEPGR